MFICWLGVCVGGLFSIYSIGTISNFVVWLVLPRSATSIRKLPPNDVKNFKRLKSRIRKRKVKSVSRSATQIPSKSIPSIETNNEPEDVVMSQPDVPVEPSPTVEEVAEKKRKKKEKKMRKKNKEKDSG